MTNQERYQYISTAALIDALKEYGPRCEVPLTPMTPVSIADHPRGTVSASRASALDLALARLGELAEALEEAHNHDQEMSNRLIAADRERLGCGDLARTMYDRVVARHYDLIDRERLGVTL